MGLDTDEYAPYLLLRRAKWLGISITELLELPLFWLEWAEIGELAEAKAQKELNRASSK